MSALEYVPPQGLRAVWPAIRDKVEAVRAACSEAWLPEDVYAAIASGDSQLWLRPDHSGLAVLRAQQRAYSGEPELLIWLAWSAPGTPGVVDANLEQLRGVARAAGIGRLMFESPRRGWERRAPAMGWEPVLTRWQIGA